MTADILRGMIIEQAFDIGVGVIILHVDMDAFYASVEMITHPELRGVPMFVGGGDRGVVLSANYPARKFGIRSGMASVSARKLCPAAVVIRPSFEKYSKASRGVFQILDSITSEVERASIDEAFLDISGSLRRLGSPLQIGDLIRKRVAEEQNIPCTVGIGPNKFIAKLASNHAKPDGLLEVTSDQVLGFLHPLPVRAMWGVGQATSTKLNSLGIYTVGDLAHSPQSTLQQVFGTGQGQSLYELAWGRDNRPVVHSEPEHSIGAQTTFAADTADPEVLRCELLRMSARTASRLRAGGWCANGVVITIRLSDFTDITRSGRLSSPSNVTDDIYAAALRLYDALGLKGSVIRLVGVRAEKLVPAESSFAQPTLDESDVGMRDVEAMVDRLITRFGPDAVSRASLTRPPRGTS